MQCPECRVEMAEPGPGRGNYWCSCGRVAAAGETAEDIEDRERGRQHALALLDLVITSRGKTPLPCREEDPMGQQIATRGCSKCGATQWKTIETDENGNPTNETTWVCGSCGHMGD